jgi:hypothetical protein
LKKQVLFARKLFKEPFSLKIVFKDAALGMCDIFITIFYSILFYIYLQPIMQAYNTLFTYYVLTTERQVFRPLVPVPPAPPSHGASSGCRRRSARLAAQAAGVAASPPGEVCPSAPASAEASAAVVTAVVAPTSAALVV